MQKKVVCVLTIVLFISIGRVNPSGVRAQDSPKATTPPASVELRNYVELATETRDDIKEQLAAMEAVPTKVKDTYLLGVQHLRAMVEAARSRDLATARKMFQKAMRAFTAISEFIAISQNGEEEITGARLQTAVKNLYSRMQKRISKLRTVDSRRSLGADFTQIEAWIAQARTAYSQSDYGQLRACLRELKQAIKQVEDYISEQLAIASDD